MISLLAPARWVGLFEFLWHPLGQHIWTPPLQIKMRQYLSLQINLINNRVSYALREPWFLNSNEIRALGVPSICICGTMKGGMCWSLSPSATPGTQRDVLPVSKSVAHRLPQITEQAHSPSRCQKTDHISGTKKIVLITELFFVFC